MPPARAASLDPAIEPEPSSTKKRPRAAEAAAGDGAAPDAARPNRAPIVVAVVAAIVVLAVVAGRGGGQGGGRSFAEDRRLSEIWLAHGAGAWGGVRQPDAVTVFVDGVGAAVTRAMEDELSGRAPRVVVLNDEATAQIFALPDGTVVVTVGLLRRLGGEAQLAALIAHALAHVVGGDVATAIALRGDLRQEAAPALATPLVAESATAPGVKAAVELVSAAATQPALPANEMAADELALAVIADAGYAPSAFNDAVRNLGMSGTQRRAAWLRQHPDDAARLGRLGTARGNGRTGDRDFGLKVLDVIGRLASKAPVVIERKPPRTPATPPATPAPARPAIPAPARPATPAPATPAPVVPDGEIIPP